VPDPGEPHETVVAPASVGLVEYSISQAVTSAPFGFTLPLSVAEELVIEDAEPVTTVGALGVDVLDPVVKACTVPSRRPPALLALTRK